jgi:hypothetical protein
MRSLYGSDGVEGIRRIDSGKTHLRTFVVVATFSFCLCPCFALLCFAFGRHSYSHHEIVSGRPDTHSGHRFRSAAISSDGSYCHPSASMEP